MFGSLLRQLPLVGSLVLALGSVPAMAQTELVPGDCSAIQFDVANPSPGSRVEPGKYVVQGIAVDTRAEDGPGVDRIDFFLGNRENGGLIVGHAVPTDQGPFAPMSFETTITLPNQLGGHELFGYAHSAVTGQESIISVPIALGVEPARAGDVLSRPPVATCTPEAPAAEPGPAAMDETPAVAQVEAPPAEMAAPAEEGPLSQMYLDVGNPSAGDTIHVGTFKVEGIAFDGAAEQSPGIDHIDVFLDDRDAGGMLVGRGVLGAANPAPDDPALAGSGWNAQVTLTSKMTGLHTLFFYALSGVTGEEMVVTIPVRVMP